MEKKLTKEMVIEQMLGEEVIQKNENYMNYLINERNLIQKKKGKSKTNVEENKKIVNIVLQVMKDLATEEKTLFTITELLKDERLSNYVLENEKYLSNSKLTYILQQEIGKTIVNVRNGKSSVYGLI